VIRNEKARPVFETGAGFDVSPRRKELTLNYIAQSPTKCTPPISEMPLLDWRQPSPIPDMTAAGRWVAHRFSLPAHVAAIVAERAGLGQKDAR
jgi:hypothetical protein